MFFKRKPTADANRQPSPVKAAVNHAANKIGSALADRVQTADSKLSEGQRKIYVVLILLVLLTVSTCHLYRALFSTATPNPTYLNRQPVAVPNLPHLPDSVYRKQKGTSPGNQIDSIIP